MKNIAKIIIALGMVFCLFTGCSKKTEGKLVIGLDASFPPMGYSESNGEIVGYDVDLAREVAKRLNLEFSTKPINWDAKEMELASGSIDCIWNGFTITDERIAAMSFTKPYLDNDQVLVVRNDGQIKSLTDAKDKIIGVQVGSSAEFAINDSPEFSSLIKEIRYYEENLTALADLEIKGIDAVVMDSVVANWAIKTGNKPLVIVDDVIAKEAYGIGFRKDENGAALRDKVWETMEQMAADGTITQICEKWFGNDISVVGK
ncbi:MAG: amino acid ABC transporter substrate-binding protein [Treponemataceae bacterium]